MGIRSVAIYSEQDMRHIHRYNDPGKESYEPKVHYDTGLKSVCTQLLCFFFKIHLFRKSTQRDLLCGLIILTIEFITEFLKKTSLQCQMEENTKLRGICFWSISLNTVVLQCTLFFRWQLAIGELESHRWTSYQYPQSVQFCFLFFHSYEKSARVS